MDHLSQVRVRRAALGVVAVLSTSVVGGCTPGGTPPPRYHVDVPGSYTLPVVDGSTDFSERRATVCVDEATALHVSFSDADTGDPKLGGIAIEWPGVSGVYLPGVYETATEVTTDEVPQGCGTVTFVPGTMTMYYTFPLEITIEEAVGA